MAVPALLLGLALAFVARPLAAAVCLLPFRFPAREVLYIGWVGLRGAVPIILATFPVLAGVPDAHRIFNLVFFVVIVSTLLPGATVGWATRRLGLESQAPAPPPASLEIASTEHLAGEVLSFHIAPSSAVAGNALADVPFPPGAGAMLVLRGRELLAARGNTLLLPDDHVYVFCRAEDRPMIKLLFGQQEAD
jgi:cell volume regulation protein A